MKLYIFKIYLPFESSSFIFFIISNASWVSLLSNSGIGESILFLYE